MATIRKIDGREKARIGTRPEVFRHNELVGVGEVVGVYEYYSTGDVQAVWAGGYVVRLGGGDLTPCYYGIDGRCHVVIEGGLNSPPTAADLERLLAAPSRRVAGSHHRTALVLCRE